ncbi:dienelactone hydrolase family protein [Alkalinema pantanalense CENA528]|uniref:dienelactone hydrolase family protein n=1 Tax=Alkalinema pantanalense TaxID=1620705 RepID=UPI003D6F65A3
MPYPITSHWVQIPSPSLPIDAYQAIPTGVEQQQFPAVIVIHEVFGVNAHMQEVTDRIAQEGYVAIAPNWFQRTAPGLNLGYGEADLALGRSHKDQTTAETILADAQAVIAYLRSQPFVQQQPIGTIGFCFGGHMAYLVGTLPEIRAVAALYGSGIAVMTPGGGAPTITRTAEITGTVYAFFGNQDPLIPNEQVDAIAAELAHQGIKHKLFRYDAGHGFFCDQRASYNPIAAADAWEQIQALFATMA